MKSTKLPIDEIGRCGTCSHWWQERGCLSTPMLGYCEMFDKATNQDHGDKCTAHSDYDNMNDESEP